MHLHWHLCALKLIRINSFASINPTAKAMYLIFRKKSSGFFFRNFAHIFIDWNLFVIYISDTNCIMERLFWAKRYLFIRFWINRLIQFNPFIFWSMMMDRFIGSLFMKMKLILLNFNWRKCFQVFAAFLLINVLF